MKELVKLISGRTGLNRGDIRQVLSELKEAISFFHLAGRAVKIEGLGSYSPRINLKGVFSISHRLDPELKSELNQDREYEGEIINRDMIGKTIEELVTRWNEEHPDDPVA